MSTHLNGDVGAYVLRTEESHNKKLMIDRDEVRKMRGFYYPYWKHFLLWVYVSLLQRGLRRAP